MASRWRTSVLADLSVNRVSSCKRSDKDWSRMPTTILIIVPKTPIVAAVSETVETGYELLD